MNEIIIDGKIYNLIGIWKKSKSDKSVDSKGKRYQFPSENKFWTGSKFFAERLADVESYIRENNKEKYIEDEKNNHKCLLCSKSITKNRYILTNYLWDSSLIHYVTHHNYEPPREFIDKIFLCDISTKEIVNLQASMSVIGSSNYLKLDKNQLMILDALMRHGGYNKKYYDTEKTNVVRYSEHAGFIDVRNKIVHNIIVSGNTLRIDRGDEEIFLPINTPDAFNYEYIFHTHPPTPKPGGRVKNGILYEFPSMGDIFHFIDHYNDGKVVGSLIMTPEGLYNIHRLKNSHTKESKNKIEINEEEFYVRMKKVFRNIQKEAIEKYGYKFSTYKFYSVIAQDTSFISKANETLNKYELAVDFFQREKDFKGSWIVDSVYVSI